MTSNKLENMLHVVGWFSWFYGLLHSVTFFSDQTEQNWWFLFVVPTY